MSVETEKDYFTEDWESLSGYECPEWFKDAKLGIFVHWGPYSVPAYRSEWYPRLMYMDKEVWSPTGVPWDDDPRAGDKPVNHVYQHHVENWGPLEEFGYKDFIPMFTADRFDPSEWMDLFVEAGAKYVVPVAEHHDSFAMYHSNHTPWNAVEMGPKRDILGELFEEGKKRDLKMGASSHLAFLWSYYNKREGWDTADPQYRDLYGWNADPHAPVDDEFLDLWWRRTSDIVDSYHPDILWFDFYWDREEFRPMHKKLAAHYYNMGIDQGKHVCLQSKNFNDFESFPAGTHTYDLERGKLAGIGKRTWQTDTSIGVNSWCHISNWITKPVNTIINDLIDIVSKNGCLLLNVGPKADGTIPEDQVKVLKELGQWMKINGDAIYGTRPWKTFGEGPTEVQVGHHTEAKNKEFTSKDFRFTQKEGRLYVIALDWPKSGKVCIKSLSEGAEHRTGKIASVRMLGGKGALPFVDSEKGLSVTVGSERLGDYAFCLEVCFE
ncbi:alpha-L-fucosidase [Pelagicoccus mobilis]|uniref:alpha-L-fucosidase n=1 Tax=Pelagicoccus mobilis TaxID=415221 RepID=A0A934VPV2_9BACT|nr:alpha-L-fucosidase [Pelagicoccus mobilis]MBK1875918.1 alpha-L-fucosidase [Pelagicoccus mobilis]